MSADTPSTGVPASTMGMLLLSVFTVSIGYGVVLPLLPSAIERLLGAAGDAAQVSRATGLLTGLYTLSMFLFAPTWGRLSDRHGRRGVLIVGLIGFGATMLVSAFTHSMPATYLERFMSGMFAAAVTPVALATIGDLAVTDEARGRRLTFLSLAGIGGFMLGPMLGAYVGRSATALLPASPAGSLAVPLVGTALLAALAAAVVALAVPGGGRTPTRTAQRRPTPEGGRWLVPRLLSLAFVVSAGVGVFEVGLALRGKQELALDQYQIATMFTECSGVMFAVQAIVFSPWIRPEATRWLIAPAMAVLAAGLLLVPLASDFTLMLVVIGAVAASAGTLSPILTYWVSDKAGKAQGAQLGKQTAASSLGAAVGSAAGGLLFDVTWLHGASFVFAAALASVGALLSIGLPGALKIVGRGDAKLVVGKGALRKLHG